MAAQSILVLLGGFRVGISSVVLCEKAVTGGTQAKGRTGLVLCVGMERVKLSTKGDRVVSCFGDSVWGLGLLGAAPLWASKLPGCTGYKRGRISIRTWGINYV